MDLPKRKNLRLPNWDYACRGAYFITLCTQNRAPILCDIFPAGDDVRVIPKKCGQIAEKYIQSIPQVAAYVVMPDHIHLLLHLQESDKTVSTIIRSFKTLITKEWGASIFQRSYYDHIVRNEKDYYEIWEYIQNNPKNWIIKHPTRR